MTVDLTPLPYQLEIADRLQRLEAAAWSAFAEAASPSAMQPADGPPGGPGLATADDPLDLALLRNAYRLEPAGHPRVHAAAARASNALGLEVPVALYQLEGGDRLNVSLVFRPHEALIAISGNVLALLDDEELAAVFGHELAHHVLWSRDGGRLRIADRLLDALASDRQASAIHLETARRFDLAGELFADRGSMLACGSLHVAVASLVKVATGLGEVDASAFLVQAEAARPGTGSGGRSHPETSLRAWALARWQDGTGDAACDTLLRPSLHIERLDLVDRERLEAATRALVGDVLGIEWLRTDAVLGHARQFFPDLAEPPAGAATPTGTPTPVPAGATPETLRYLAFVLLDFATVDPDLDAEPLAAAIAIARAIGLGPVFEEVARAELDLGVRAWERLARRAADLNLAGAPPAAAPAAGA